MQSKVRSSYLRSQFANKYLNIRERVEVVKRNEDGFLFSPALQWIVNVCQKKMYANEMVNEVCKDE